jgi:hypothetical protein
MKDDGSGLYGGCIERRALPGSLQALTRAASAIRVSMTCLADFVPKMLSFGVQTSPQAL